MPALNGATSDLQITQLSKPLLFSSPLLLFSHAHKSTLPRPHRHRAAAEANDTHRYPELSASANNTHRYPELSASAMGEVSKILPLHHHHPLNHPLKFKQFWVPISGNQEEGRRRRSKEGRSQRREKGSH